MTLPVCVKASAQMNLIRLAANVGRSISAAISGGLSRAAAYLLISLYRRSTYRLQFGRARRKAWDRLLSGNVLRRRSCALAMTPRESLMALAGAPPSIATRLHASLGLNCVFIRCVFCDAKSVRLFASSCVVREYCERLGGALRADFIDHAE